MKSLFSRPKLVVIIVGNHEASMTYVHNKKKAAHSIGMESEIITLQSHCSQQELLENVHKLNIDPTVHGILVQLPLPKGIDPLLIGQAIDPLKDVDGLHPQNMGMLLLGMKEGFAPCTPHGIQELLKRSNIAVEGKHMVIIGRSNIVGKPLAALMMQKQRGANASVTLLHTQSKNIAPIAKEADILVACCGVKHLIDATFVHENSVVIDVGIHQTEYGLAGDVNFDEVAPIVRAITPVPGGVGPMTIAMLLQNTLKAYELQHNLL